MTASGDADVPRPYVSWDVHWKRLSPPACRRLASVKTSNFAVTDACFLADADTLPSIDEICVVSGGPKNRARLAPMPRVRPVDGLELMVGTNARPPLRSSSGVSGGGGGL